MWHVFSDWSAILVVNPVRRPFASKLRGPGYKPQPDTVGSLVTIIMWGALPG